MLRVRQAVCVALLLLAGTVSSIAQQGPGTKDGGGPELVSAAGGEWMLRYPVAHYQGRPHVILHTYSGGTCYGYLYVSRESVRYDVVWPEKDKGHSFELRRADVASAEEWVYLGVATQLLQIKSRSGVDYHFFHVPRRFVESPGQKFQWGEHLSYKEVADGVQGFDGVLATLKAREAPLPAPAGAKSAVATPALTKPPAVASPVAAPAPAPATLRIATQPGSVQVYVDDEPKGMTSANEGELVLRNLPAGQYRIRLSLEDHEQWTKKVELAAGQDLKLEAKLTPRGPKPFTLTNVVDMLLGGISSKRAAMLVRERGVDFAVDDKAEQQIRAAGGDAELLVVIGRSKK